MRLLAAACVAGALSAPGAAAQEAGNPAETAAALARLTFTSTEARRGEAIYGASCARCHGAKLDGMDGPPLTGATFEQRYAGKSAAEFLVRLRTTMPADAPGSLSQQQYLGLVAFLAQAHGAEPGDDKMPADEAVLATMSFLPPAPAD